MQTIPDILGLDIKILALVKTGGDPDALLSTIYDRCLRLAPQFMVEVDHSPVMSSNQSFAARIDHSENRIVLNGALLRKTHTPTRMRHFLEVHELCHEVFKTSGVEKFEWLRKLNLSEEQLCDAVALFAIENQKTNA